MKKLLMGAILFILGMPVYGDDVATPGVTERTDCASVRAEMDRLSKTVDPDSETTARIAELTAVYRSDCVVRTSSGRQASGRGQIHEGDGLGLIDNPVDAADVVTESIAEIEPKPVESPEDLAARIAANIAAGLCPDGTSANKYGCCDGERFKDTGGLVFKCCPKDGGDCVDPRP